MIASIWQYLVDPQNNATLNAINTLTGTLGFAITLIGFAVALCRLRKLETAARTAQTAVENVQFRASQNDAIRDISDARNALGLVRKSLATEAWQDVADAYEDVQAALAQIPAVTLSRDSAVHDGIRRMVSQIEKICATIDRWSDDPSKPRPDKSEIKKHIRRHTEVINKTQALLQRKSS